MRLNRYLASTLLTGLFVTAAVFTPPAMGQEQSLKPQGAWSVAKIDRAAQGGNSYCTLSRQYDNGAVLSLGRNQTEEYSLAIDFQKPVFERGKSLKINLQPGPGQIRAYDMMPASEKAVVVRLGWDTGFFDTLNKSQQMKVKIADKDYAFTLPEIAKGQQDLTNCMEELQASAKAAKGAIQSAANSKDVLNADPAANKAFDAGKAPSAAPSPAPVAAASAAPVPAIPAVSKTQVEAQEKAALKNFADSMTAQEKGTKDDASLRRQNFAGRVDDTPQAQSASAATKAEVPPPPSAVQPSAPAPVPAQSAKAQQAQSLPSPETQQQLAELQAKNKEMHQQLVAAGQVAERAMIMQKQLADLQAQNKQLQEKASSVSPQVQQQLAAAEAEKAALKKQIQDLADHSQKIQNGGMTPLPDETQALKAVKNDNATLQKKLADLTEQNRILAQKAATPAAVDPSEKAVLQKQIDDLKAQNVALQKAAAGIAPAGGVAKTDAPIASAEMATLQKQIEELKAQNAALQKAQAKGGDAVQSAQVKELEAKNAQLEESLRQAQVRIAEAAVNSGSKSMQRVAELETKLQAAQVDNKNLAQQLESMRVQQEDKALSFVAGDWNLESATKRYNEAEREVRRLGLQLEQSRSTCNREKAQIEQMLFDPAVTDQKQLERLSELEGQLKAAESKIAELQRGGAIASAPLAPMAMASPPQAAPSGATWEARAEGRVLRDQNVQLRQETEKLRMQLADATINGGARSDQVASMQLQIDSLKRQAATKDTQLATYQNQIASIQSSGPRIAAATPSAEDFASITPAAGYVSPSPMAPPPVAAPAPRAIQASTATAASSGASLAGYDKGAIQSLLQKSGLTIGGVSVASSGFAGADNFNWTDSSNVKGLASVKMLGGKSFDDMVAQYIAYQKSQCSGDFASMPSPSGGAGPKKMALHEVACVGASGNQSASLIFFEDQGRFIAIANQIQAADMDLAMDSRDRIASFVRGL